MEKEIETQHVNIVKFPRTHHVFDASTNDKSGISRDDLVMDAKEAKMWFDAEVVAEEKVDGANLGISMDENYILRFQNRSHFVTSETSQQWKQLASWSNTHSAALYQVLESPDYVLYGEWMYAKHSIHYTELPDLFLAFDIWDIKANKFLSQAERDKRLAGSGIHYVPLVAHGKFNKDQMRALLNTKSKYYDGPIEGIYLRIDDSKHLQARAKVVRPDFIQSDEMESHWAGKQLTKNIVKYF